MASIGVATIEPISPGREGGGDDGKGAKRCREPRKDILPSVCSKPVPDALSTASLPGSVVLLVVQRSLRKCDDRTQLLASQADGQQGLTCGRPPGRERERSHLSRPWNGARAGTAEDRSHPEGAGLPRSRARRFATVGSFEVSGSWLNQARASRDWVQVRVTSWHC